MEAEFARQQLVPRRLQKRFIGERVDEHNPERNEAKQRKSAQHRVHQNKKQPFSHFDHTLTGWD